ncbi:Mitochondrial uncoupling protein 2 [Morella rubra]|uniref:Mitochondrial uncoupling protein 2 n=1 Tax=Morella rubra TaxID=262757 RepID=A0A6A1V072_9ROSI|nr:Mitochondrial uncoupling protein 2 [Morella rubra]
MHSRSYGSTKANLSPPPPPKALTLKCNIVEIRQLDVCSTTIERDIMIVVCCSNVKAEAEGCSSSAWPLETNPNHELARSDLAALLTGALAILVANRIDQVKVRLQAEEKIPAGLRRRYSGALDAYLTVVRQEGLGALWTGLGPNVARNAIVIFSKLSHAVEEEDVDAEEDVDDAYKEGDFSRSLIILIYLNILLFSYLYKNL